MCYQGTFCIITAALISGAIVERMRFSAYVAFITLWALVVYAPIAHWVWGGGWLADMGALDFAGGTVVHVNAGVAALVAALVVGKRRDFKNVGAHAAQRPVRAARRRPALVRLVRVQCRQRASAASHSAALAFTTTFLAPMGTLVVWTLLDYARGGKPTAVGAATAIVVGLVAVTPAAGFIGPMSAIALGAIAAVPSYFGLIWRAKTSLDDSLDVVAAHGVGGTVGALLTGVFAQKALNGIADGAAVRQPGAARDPGRGRRRGDRLQRRRQLRAAQADWRCSCRCARTRPTRATGLDLTHARRRGLRARREAARRSSRQLPRARRPRCRCSRPPDCPNRCSQAGAGARLVSRAPASGRCDVYVRCRRT